MNERIKELRKVLHLTMEKFGEKLGVKKSAISLIESGRNNLTDQMIVAICNAYSVSEEWLRTGSGEMFILSCDNYIDEVSKSYNLDDLSQSILKTYIEMDSKKRAAFNSFIEELAANVMTDNKEKPINNTNDVEKTDKEERDAFLKMAAEQFDKEKDAELKASSAKELDVG